MFNHLIYKIMSRVAMFGVLKTWWTLVISRNKEWKITIRFELLLFCLLGDQNRQHHTHIPVPKGHSEQHVLQPEYAHQDGNWRAAWGRPLWPQEQFVGFMKWILTLRFSWRQHICCLIKLTKTKKATKLEFNSHKDYAQKKPSSLKQRLLVYNFNMNWLCEECCNRGKGFPLYVNFCLFILLYAQNTLQEMTKQTDCHLICYHTHKLSSYFYAFLLW